MELDRRHFTLASLLFLSSACAMSSACSAKAGDDWWRAWRERFLAADGRVVDNGNNGISHSEGQGYGLTIALAQGDREAFARILGWTEAHLARPDMALYSWRYDPSAADPVADPNNATDGDMLIAWALGSAGQRWNEPAYLARAARIRAAIRGKCVIERYGRQLLLPGIVGFAEPERVMLNPSYFIWPALDAFARLDGAKIWGRVIDDCEDLVALAKFGRYRLPTDWIAITGAKAVAPAPGKPPRFGFDAIRMPLYAKLGRREKLVGDIAAFWRGRNARNRMLPAWIDVITDEEAPYGVSNGGLAIAAPYIGASPPNVLANDYFAASLQMLARGGPG